MALLDSGLFGDVYRLKGCKVEKIVFECAEHKEAMYLKQLQGAYGIPKLYETKTYVIKRFFGKNGDGIYCNHRDALVKRGPAHSIIMEYAGDLTLDNYSQFTINQLLKIMFNVSYIVHTMYNKYNLIHGDLHRRNVVLKRVKPYCKTYYIDGAKYRVSNQLYKVTLIDFDNCKAATPHNTMDDLRYLCSFFDTKFEVTETMQEFFESNFECYKQG